MLILDGLSLMHPGAALASFGLLSVFPKAKLSFIARRNTHVAVLHSDEVETYGDLAKKLADPLTWHKLNLPPKQDRCDLIENSQVLLDPDYHHLFQDDEEMAAGLATDLKVRAERDYSNKKRRTGIAAEPTPLYFPNATCSTWGKRVNQQLDLLKGPNAVDEIEKFLTQPVWPQEIYHPGNNMGYLPENVTGEVFRNVRKVKVKKPRRKRGEPKEPPEPKNNIVTIPVMVLLCFAAWRLFPVHLRGRKVVVPGWYLKYGKPVFVYPAFTNPLSAQGFRTLMLNPMLNPDDRYKEYRHGKTVLRTLGVDGLYECGCHKRPNGGGNFFLANRV